MPWEVTGPVRERERFIESYLTGLYTITELADRFGVSRQKLHKWLSRHDADGAKGLADRSRAPMHIPHRTSEAVAAKIIEFRRRFPFMGAQDRRPARRAASPHPLAGAEYRRRHPVPRAPDPTPRTPLPACPPPPCPKRAARAQ